MSKFISISVIVLLLGVPLATPLLAHIPCCPNNTAPKVRPASSMPCCQVTTLPHSSPVVQSLAPELAVPAPAGLHVDTTTLINAEPVLEASATFHSASLNVPIRI